MIKVLFVCTGNVFRSMIAEKCLKYYLKENNIRDIEVDSAGIAPFPQKIQIDAIERLSFYNILVDHEYKRINQGLVDGSNLIIAMNFNHKNYLKEKFKIESPLFNEVAHNKEEGILDFQEHDPSLSNLSDINKKEEIQEYAYYIVDYIYNSTPNLVSNIDKWI